MKNSQILLLALGLLLFVSCQRDDDDSGNGFGGNNDIPDINQIDPQGNGNTGIDDAAIIELGQMLFWDPVLSGEKDIACATCHHPDFGYADGRDLPIGVGGKGLGPQRQDVTNDDIGFVTRNSPTIINTAFNGMDEDGDFNPDLAPMFWDNRTLSLETQAIGPLLSFEEMRGHAYDESLALDSIINRLNAIPQYRDLFSNAFGNPNTITSQNIGLAIASFERTITATDSPFDRFNAGNQNAMTQQQIRGMNRFNQVGCNDCHSGPMFSDFDLHVLGVPDNNLLDFSDSGADGTYAFRTPTLRNLNETGPYFHNGVGRDLQQTIQFYIRARNAANNNNGGGGGGPGGLNVNPNVNGNDIDDEVRDLRNFNNGDVQDIIAFIQALNDPNFDRTIPNNVPSGLNPGGRID